jgi:hypothetical protein
MTDKQKTIEVTSDGYNFEFHCSPDAPIGQAYDALWKMLSFVSQRIQDATKAREAIEPEAEVVVTSNE